MKLEDLKLYQECLDFEQQIWDIVNQWEGFNKDTVGKPFLQSADAISGNIASGYGRYNFKDKKWLKFNDKEISEVEKSIVMEEAQGIDSKNVSAYGLIYLPEN